MADRGLDVFEKYDFEVRGTSKGRGVIVADTDKGPRLLKNYIGSGKHLVWCGEILERINEGGTLLVDAYEKNNEGQYITESEDGGKYVIKKWYPCRECDIKIYGDVTAAIRTLAFLHKELSLVEAPAEYEEKSLVEEYQRKGKELARIKKFLSTRYEKTEFEQLAAKSFDEFMPEVEGVSQYVVNYFAEHSIKQKLRHGSFNHHNIGFSETLPVVSNFEKMSYSYQLKDLYTFMRKIMEKNNWDMKVGYGMLNEYDRVMPIGEEELELLYILFAFPEKYWKLMNNYYNAKKSFLPAKNMEKLWRLIEQNSSRKAFIDTIH